MLKHIKNISLNIFRNTTDTKRKPEHTLRGFLRRSGKEYYGCPKRPAQERHHV